MTEVETLVEQEALDLAPLHDILKEYKGEKGSVIPVLQKAQEIYGWLPSEVMEAVARGMGVPLSRIYGVATFYSQFYLSLRGRHIIRQCDGTACHVRGSDKIIDAVEKELDIRAGETTSDYQVTFEVVYCVGSCGLAPVATVDDNVIGHLVPERMLEVIRELD